MTTGYVFHPEHLWHDTGTSAGLLPANPAAGIPPAAHIENPEAKRRAHESIHACGLLGELMVIEPRRPPWRNCCGLTPRSTSGASRPRATR
ncbi:hypothetical protein MCAG_05631 [Micromonospora sp. ATCC 39149]|nr:hypothetical protein MCAG_05631 [Micromonospora sp. ATCC 39149]